MTLSKTLIKTTLSSAVVAAGLAAGMLASGGTPAGAQPAPPGAPPKPAEVWNGHPVVWNPAWGGRWGVWINGGWISLSSNPVTGGG